MSTIVTREDTLPRSFEWNVDAVVELLLRPERFFPQYLEAWPQTLPRLVIWVVGVGAVIDRIDRAVLLAERTGAGFLVQGMTSNWVLFWAMAMVGGLFAGMFAWWVLGWWYWIRLKLSGARFPDAWKARLLFIHASAVSAVTAVAVVLLEMPLRENYAELANSDRLARAALVMPFWSIFISYRGVVACFDVRRGRARLWFAILPAAFFVAVIILVGLLLVSSTP